MKSQSKILGVVGILFALALACSISPQEPDSDQSVLATLVEATTSARLTHNAPQPTATPLPPATDTPIPPAAATPDPSTVYAPDPLPAQYTGLIFETGACYNFDTYQPVAVDDLTRDICMPQYGLLEPQNGGLISGSAPMEPPSKGYCINPNLLPDPVAVQTDLYLCFQTNQGTYGFFVAREYQMDLDRVIFDLYLFP
ncbi:MAG: hypothetical protein JW757_10160 [Anaerolineales bacterium]|nr:hypothetical protein [Anaerolineales bacterium]